MLLLKFHHFSAVIHDVIPVIFSQNTYKYYVISDITLSYLLGNTVNGDHYHFAKLNQKWSKLRTSN